MKKIIDPQILLQELTLKAEMSEARCRDAEAKLRLLEVQVKIREIREQL